MAQVEATGFFSTNFDRLMSLARSNSLWYFSANTGCCADEVFQTWGCRYDIERFGSLIQVHPQHADVLVVSGFLSKAASPELKKVYEQMKSPKYVIAVGACSCRGGAFSGPYSYSSCEGVSEALPVDVYVPGCPPRPEAIMNGLIILQEKIRGNQRAQTTY